MENFLSTQMELNDLALEGQKLLSKRVDLNAKKNALCFEMINKLLEIVEDHEHDMERMEEEINTLKRRLEEKETL